eukprot:CAMPEP_0205807212 /NCGR_PEP_ID=MMETSP0205-20121125/10919_1 /ASSEMBLY_ACC=CAM_ASM_000278 /TAXON_ID=36767 /ORGANISM="Euplotes focardii, Strain TN1" /LENGTH=65 /DNA_ID=CAMNT_0053081171 /DNA_START=199 /DNA_END=393 /DNA_ORIENTATION=+
MEAFSQSKGKKENKPLVMAVKNSIKDSYLVAGVLGKNNNYLKDRNEFGSQFRAAAENANVQFNHD